MGDIVAEDREGRPGVKILREATAAMRPTITTMIKRGISIIDPLVFIRVLLFVRPNG